MSSERKEFLEKKWLSYPPFPAGFDSKYANRFSEISKMPMQVHVQLLPSLEIIKLLAVDLEKYLDGEVFQPLKHKEFFKKFQVDAWTVYWENGSDFAPEFLCDLLLRQAVTD